MQFDKAFRYMNRFPWLEAYFEKVVRHECDSGNRGWIVAMFRNTRYIAARPIARLDLDSTQTCMYEFPIPKPQVGAEKPVDMMAFCATSPVMFRMSRKFGKQTVEDCSVATEDRLTYSGSATLCFRFRTQPRDKYLFEYLPSTHSIRDAITELCAKYGHSDNLEPLGIVVSRLIWSGTHFEIFRTFDIYAPELHRFWGVEGFCKAKHRR